MAKISPDLLAILRARPALTERLFDGPDDAAPLTGFDPDRDAFGSDYRILSAIAEAIQAEHPPFAEERSWLSYAVHGTDDTLDVELGYGPAFVLDPAEVARLAAGQTDDAGHADPEHDGPDAEGDGGIDDFFAAAAREGRAIIFAIT